MTEMFRLSGSRIVHEKFDDETIIVDLETGKYYSMLVVGSAIWALATAGLTREAVLREISSRYPAEADRVAADASAFLDDLLGDGLIVAEPSPAGAVVPAGDPLAGFEFPALYFAPRLQKYADMEEMLALDPIHDVDDIGWPVQKDGAA